MDLVHQLQTLLGKLRKPVELADADRFPYERDWFLMLTGVALLGVILIGGFVIERQLFGGTLVDDSAAVAKVKGIDKNKLDTILQTYRAKKAEFEKLR